VGPDLGEAYDWAVKTLALPLALLGLLLVACSDGAADEGPGGPALVASPSCGAPGTRVVLRLETDADESVPACTQTSAFSVVFSASRPARVELAGLTDAGYCAIDVLVPDGATSGAVKVTIGGQVFRTREPFSVPCP
jgi:hypothetical protein